MIERVNYMPGHHIQRTIQFALSPTDKVLSWFWNSVLDLRHLHKSKTKKIKDKLKISPTLNLLTKKVIFPLLKKKKNQKVVVFACFHKQTATRKKLGRSQNSLKKYRIKEFHLCCSNSSIFLKYCI